MGLKLVDAALLILYAGLLACGQMIFKYVAKGLGGDLSLVQAFPKLLLTPAFWLCGCLYAFLMVYWIWLLARIPLSIAYPVSSLSVVIVPLIGLAVFLERPAPHYWIGLALIFAGVNLVVR